MHTQAQRLSILSLLCGMALSWNGHTHIMTARVAYDHLAATSPNVLAHATSLLQELEQSQPSITTKEDDYPFVECTTMADDMKSQGWSWQSEWHYVDYPFLDQGGSVDDYPKYTGITPQNITIVMTDLVNWLKGSSGYQNSQTYKTITSHYNAADSKSIALRLLIHFMGDIHQPLHCLSRLDKSFPEGDRGGNDFDLKSKDSIDELHALWDAVIYTTHASEHIPFTSQSWVDFGKETTEVVSKYSFTSDETKNVNFYSISDESFKIGTQTSYKNIEINGAVSQAYQDTNVAIAERQVVLGGLRLAYLMTTIFPNTAVEVVEVAAAKEVATLFLQ